MLVTERPGRLRVIRDGVLDPMPVGPLPEIRTAVLGGLMDIARHPDFEENRMIYFTYSRPGDLHKFAADCDAIGMEGLKREVQAAVLIDSHISGTKYLRVTTAIRLIAWSSIFGFLYLAAIQF
jgi:glucose/arabinose dehydrogenase